jgi:excisionase family DNA binding protein
VFTVGLRQVTEVLSVLDLDDLSLLTVGEVAWVLRVSKMTVYRMIHAGELTAVRVGRGFRVPTTAVRSYLDNAHVGAAQLAAA